VAWFTDPIVPSPDWHITPSVNPDEWVEEEELEED
jgi:hypothetical protein